MRAVIRAMLMIFIIIGLGLPFVVDWQVHRWLKGLAAADPVPNQGAMLIAFSMLVGSVIVAGIVVTVSLLALKYIRRNQ